MVLMDLSKKYQIGVCSSKLRIFVFVQNGSLRYPSIATQENTYDDDNGLEYCKEPMFIPNSVGK
jgi:hypothetical protein